MKPSSENRSPALRPLSTALKIRENPPPRLTRSEKSKEIIGSSLNSISGDEKVAGKWECTETGEGQCKWTCTDMPENDVNLSGEEVQLLEEASAQTQLPSVTETDFMTLGISSHLPIKTPLFFSQCNLQTGTFESIGQNPHYQYMEVPLPDQTQIYDQANIFVSHLRNMSSDLDKTAQSLDNHSRSSANIMLQANDMAHLLTNQNREYEHTLHTLSSKIDVLIDYVKNRAIQTEFHLKDMQRKLETVENRMTVMSQRQQTILSETYQTQMMVDLIFKSCQEVPGFRAPAEFVPDQAHVPPVQNFLSPAANP